MGFNPIIACSSRSWQKNYPRPTMTGNVRVATFCELPGILHPVERAHCASNGRSQFLLNRASRKGCFFWETSLAAVRTLEKGKGCDIGYALGISSCEEANSVETCTVTALDAITAFAVPNPNCPSQSRRFFQVWLPVGLPRRADHSAYFGLAKV